MRRQPRTRPLLQHSPILTRQHDQERRPTRHRTSQTSYRKNYTAVLIGTSTSVSGVDEQPLDLAPGSPELRFTPELLSEIEAELHDVEAAIESLQLDRVVAP